MTDPGLATALQRFGLTDFRPGQIEVIRAVMQGRDCLCIMPTGGGKSLCFQLPSLLRDGTTLVVSPLIALMKDQVDALVSKGIRASYVNSSLAPAEQQQRLQQLARREYDLLYVAPERFRSRSFVEAARTARISLLAVDEAHCISEWGHDFRHDYSRLGEYRARLGNPQTIALSATATPEVRQDICQQLRLRDPATLVAGFSRPNLYLAVAHCRDTNDKHQILTQFLRSNLGCGIVYAATRKACESLMAEVAMVSGRQVVLYHGGMDNEERKKSQEAFMSGEAEIAVATNAFGMGIDKADLRFVIHYHFPGSIEAYYQEAGRAGRDGQPAECLMLFSEKDRYIQEFFIESAYPEPEIVRRVYEFLRTHPDDPVEMTQQEIRGQLGLKISQEGVGTCERLLEKAGALERLEPRHNLAIVRILSDLPTLVDLLPRQAKAQRQVLRHAERVVGDQRGEDVFFSPNSWCRELGIEPANLSRHLKELRKLRGFDYIPPFRGRAVRVLDRDRPFEDLQIDFAHLEERKKSDFDKLSRMTRFARLNRCRQQAILDYFGDPAACACGNCDVCRPRPSRLAGSPESKTLEETIRIPLAQEPSLHRTVRIVLSAAARAAERVGKNLLSGMLQGSQAAKIQKLRLDQLSTFGLLSHLTQSEILELVEACVQEGWLEQKEKDRFRPVVRLTDSGRTIMRQARAGQESLEIPRTLLAKIVGHAPVGPQGNSEHATQKRPLDRKQVESGAAEFPSAPDLSQIPRATAPTELPSFFWSWRLLAAGFTPVELLAIRGISYDTLLDHAIRAVEAGYSVDPSWIFSPEELRELNETAPVQGEKLLRSDISARRLHPKMLLFLRTRHRTTLAAP